MSSAYPRAAAPQSHRRPDSSLGFDPYPRNPPVMPSSLPRSPAVAEETGNRNKAESTRLQPNYITPESTIDLRQLTRGRQPRSRRRSGKRRSRPGRARHGTRPHTRCSSPCCPAGRTCSTCTCSKSGYAIRLKNKLRWPIWGPAGRTCSTCTCTSWAVGGISVKIATRANCRLRQPQAPRRSHKQCMCLQHRRGQ